MSISATGANRKQSQPPHQPPKIRCLVIQMCRLGDTLQSLMALRAAKQLYPQLEIHFVARERFASAAKRVPWLHQVIPFPSDQILSPLLQGKRSREQGLRDVASWVRPLVQEPWDFIVNWSYSESSSYLTGLLPSRVKLGFSRRNDGTLSCLDGWSHYIQAIVQGQIEQNIHLTDILTTQLLTALQIHVGDPSDAGNAQVTSKTFFSLELCEKDLLLAHSNHERSKKWVALQLGAGSECKIWDIANWARLGKLILDRHPECQLVLLGGQEDIPRSKELLSLIPTKRVLSLVGKTDFDLWASVVSRCQWLIAGDTAAIHLASVLGTRVLNISVGPVRLTETGPYGNGHYVVSNLAPCTGCASGAKELPAHTCRKDVSPEAAYATWSFASSDWALRAPRALEQHFSELGWASEISKIRVFRSKIRATDDGGGVKFEPLIHRTLSLQEWNAQVIGHIARAWYCGWVPAMGQEISRDRISPALIQSLRKIQESSGILGKLCEEARKTAIELSLKSSTLKSSKVMDLRDRNGLQDLGLRLTEIDQLVDRLAATDPSLAAFSQMSKVLMHNLNGSLLSDLGKETAESYRQLGRGVAILREWIDHTLSLAKPVSIKRASVSPLEREVTP